MSALAFAGLLFIPVDFSYPEFAALIFVAGAGMGLFSAPNAAAIMNSVPARQRGAASGMLATFQNSGFVLSIGIFFSLMIAGLAATLPTTLTRGLTAQGVPHSIAHQIGSLPPVGSLFAAFLGYNPVHELLGPTGVLNHLPPANAAVLTGRTFFPQLISQPFHHGLVIVFSMAIAVLLIAAAASALRGGKFVHEDGAEAATLAVGAATSGAGTDIFSDDLAAADAPTDGDDDASDRATGNGATGDGAASKAAAAGVATGDGAASNGVAAGEANATSGERTGADGAMRRPG